MYFSYLAPKCLVFELYQYPHCAHRILPEKVRCRDAKRTITQCSGISLWFLTYFMLRKSTVLLFCSSASRLGYFTLSLAFRSNPRRFLQLWSAFLFQSGAVNEVEQAAIYTQVTPTRRITTIRSPSSSFNAISLSPFPERGKPRTTNVGGRPLIRPSPP